MSLSIRVPDDFHLHLRTGSMLRRVTQYSSLHFGRGLIMPNVPPVCIANDLVVYRNEIMDVLNRQIVGFQQSAYFEPLMTIKIDSKTLPEYISEAKKVGAIAAKLYPAGVTTGSAGGVQDFDSLAPIMEALQSCNMVLCIHGEMPSAFCLDREKKFLPTIAAIVKNFPKLRVVLEHITTVEAVEFVREARAGVAATITAHHLVDTLDAVVGDLLNPHRFCKPIAKYPEDRTILRAAATSGNPKFFFGSDSAPHEKSAKECASGCAGCFTAPVAIPTLAEVFEEENALPLLNDFTSRFGAEHYELPLNKGELVLVREPKNVPAEYDGIIPWRANETLRYSVVARS